MNPTQQKEMIDRLKNSDNIAEAMKILNQYYDLDNCRPGKIVKSAFTSKLVGAMSSLGAKTRF